MMDSVSQASFPAGPKGGDLPRAERTCGSQIWLKWAVLGCVAFITVFHLGSAAVGRSIYRDIHLGTALAYSKGPINLLKPVVIGFNLNDTPTPQELPVWQASAGLAFKLFGSWFGWANLVSL